MEIPQPLVEALRAHLDGDEEAHARLIEPFAQHQHAGYPLLVMAAFREAAERCFTESRALADIVRYVGHVRARGQPDSLDPVIAEKTLHAALGDADALVHVSPSDHIIVQLELLPALVRDGRLRSDDLDGFLERARTRAESISVTS